MRDTGLIPARDATPLPKSTIQIEKMLYSLKTKIENTDGAVREDGVAYRVCNTT